MRWVTKVYGFNIRGGLGSTGKIMETTGNKYNMYYGYILNEEESDEFCFNNN